MVSRVTINTNSLNVPWSLGTTYRIALDAGFVAEPGNNRSGNPAVNNLVTFTTNASRPQLNSTNPSNGDNDVTNNTSITLTFSRNVEAGPGTIRLYRADNTDELIYTYNMGDPAWVTISNTTVTLKTTGLLREEELYLLLIDNNAIRDLDNFTYLGSRTAKTITAAGNAQWNNTESKFGGTASIQFDGVGDYVTVATASDFAWSTNTFTWEAWIKKTSVTGTQAIFDQRTASLLNNGYLYTAGTQLIYQAAGSARITSASSVIQNNTWYNIMLTRDITGTTKLYVNGTQVGSSYTDSNNYAQAPVIIGADYLGSNGFVGYMEDIRFRKLISGATALPTKYRVNDPDTVLHIIQSGEAVNGSQTIEDNVSTVQFDTANQSQGFRGLSANLTGAFAPTFTISVNKKALTILGAQFTLNATIKKTVYGVCSMSAQFTQTASIRYTTNGRSTINSTFTQTAAYNRTRTVDSTLNTSFGSQFKVGYFLNTSPWFGAIDQQNALEQNYITQSDLNNMPLGVVELSPTTSTNQFAYYTAINQVQYSGSPSNFILYINKIVDSSNSYAGSLEIKYDNANTISFSQTTITINNPDSANGEKYFGNYVYVDFATHRLITSGINKTWIFNLNTGALLQTYTNPIQYNLSTFNWSQGADTIREHFGRSTHKNNLVSIIQADQNSPYNTKVKIYNYAGTLQTDLTVSDIELGTGNDPTFIATILTNTRFAVSSYTAAYRPAPNINDQDIVWIHKIYDLSNTVIQTINGPTFIMPSAYAYGRSLRQQLQEQTTASVSGRIFVLGPHTIQSGSVSPSPIAIELSQYYVNTSL
jgi:hypothetical protein